MKQNPSIRSNTRQDRLWGHLLVSVAACLLTVSIVGSATFLVWRLIDRRQLNARVEEFVASLENRTPAELADEARNLKSRPKLARHVLPAITRSLRNSKSENRQRAAIEISKAFLDNDHIVKTLVALRHDPRESVAAAAVDVLSEVKPEARAADLMGQCLADSHTAAACDAACAGLYRLGETGLDEMKKRLTSLSPGRRIWLVSYIVNHPAPGAPAWLETLSKDKEPRVHEAAEAALTSVIANPPNGDDDNTKAGSSGTAAPAPGA